VKMNIKDTEVLNKRIILANGRVPPGHYPYKMERLCFELLSFQVSFLQFVYFHKDIL